MPDESTFLPRIDGAIAALLALAGLWMIQVGTAAARDAAARYGRNVDSGVLEYAFATLYLFPLTVLFAAAAIAAWRRWRYRRVIHWAAVLAATVPLAGVALAAMLHR